MKQKPFLLLIFFIIIGFTTCGIEEYFYLPQIPQGSESANEVSITLPSSSFYYASSYIIYYKIYLSNAAPFLSTINLSEFPSINSRLAEDWNNLSRFFDSTTTNVPSRSDFSNRGYFELEFETANILSIGTTDRSLRINFPSSDPAEIYINGTQSGPILRNNNSGFEHSPDRYFRNSSDLRINENAGTTGTHNHDIAPVPNSTGEALNAYVCMFIVTSGTNPIDFNPILSKPTYLGVFLLQPH